MPARFPLSSRILLLAAVNVVLLIALLVVFVRFELGVDVDQLLFAPAQDRARSVGRAIAVDLEATPASARTALLGRYRANYGVDFYLFDNNGPQMAGPPVTLPADVAAEVAMPRAGAPPAGDPDQAPPPPPGRKGRGRGGRGRDGKGRGPEGTRPGLFQKSSAGLYWVGVRIPVPGPDGDSPLRATVVMAARSFYGTPLFFNFWPWFGAVGAAIALCALCWLPFIRGVTSSVTRVTRATQQIAEGHFEHHLPEDRSDELGQLAASINSMAARLSGFVTGQKRFLGDIAHELCAPLARIEFGMGILEHRAPPEERAAVADVQDEVRHMSGLVEELLSFSKAGIASGDRVLLPVDVAEAAETSVSQEAAGGRVAIEVEPNTFALADQAYLVRALSNLIRNALRYAGDAGPVMVSAHHDRGHVVIRVSDSGPGLPPEELERIFTPFYRPEKARTRESGGTGLGLAIVKSCVEACGGSVVCRNRVPAGLEVEIRLKAA